MLEKTTIAQELEQRLFRRFCSALSKCIPETESLWVDCTAEGGAVEDEIENILWGYGFSMKDLHLDNTTLSINGIITGDLARPFREFLHSYEIKFHCTADWWSGKESKEQEVRVDDFENFTIDVLHTLDVDTLEKIKLGVDAYVVEKTLLGETNPFANRFDEMFEKQ